MSACSLPTEFQHKTKLDRQACMSIELWKDYSTSTDAERDAHLRKFYLRFQKLKSGEINANASVALNDYEVCDFSLLLHQFEDNCWVFFSLC